MKSNRAQVKSNRAETDNFCAIKFFPYAIIIFPYAINIFLYAMKISGLRLKYLLWDKRKILQGLPAGLSVVKIFLS